MKQTTFLIFYCVLQTTFLCAQSTVLRQALSVSTADTTRYRLLQQLGKDYENNNRDSALFFYRTYLDLAEKNNAQKDIAWASYGLGKTHSYHLNDKEGLKWFEKATLIAEQIQEHTLLTKAYLRIGSIFEEQKLDDDAGKFFAKAELHAEQIDDISTKIDVYRRVASYFYDIPDKIEKAKAYTLKAFNLAEDIPSLWIVLAGERCYALRKAGDSIQSNIIHNKALQLLQKGALDLTNVENMSRVLYLHTQANKIDYVEATYKEIVKMVKTRQDSAILVDDMYDVAYARARQGNYKGAYELMRQADYLYDDARFSSTSRAVQVQALKTDAAFEIAQKERERVYQQRISIVIGLALLLTLALAYFIYRNRQSIAQQKAELEDLNRTKDRLLAIIAHDLRSPIGWLKDSYDLMDNNLSTPEKTQRFLSKSKERVERVYNTMENLLVWALAQRNGLNPRFESVTVANLVEEQLQNVRDFANRKSISLKNETPQYLTVWADSNQMGIVLNNLLQNAIKFTPSGGSVAISAEMTEAQEVTLKVMDTGVGMDAKIWEEQLKSKSILSTEGTAKEKGTGLGLFLVKEIVDKNGGSLAIQSVKNEGTTVSIQLKNK